MFQNMKIGTRLNLSFSLIVIILLGSAGFECMRIFSLVSALGLGADTKNDAVNTIWIAIVVGGFPMLFAIFASYFTTRSIVNPIKSTIGMLKDIAEGEGDLTKRLAVLGNDEIGEMNGWFHRFVSKLQAMLVERKTLPVICRVYLGDRSRVQYFRCQETAMYCHGDFAQTRRKMRLKHSRFHKISIASYPAYFSSFR